MKNPSSPADPDFHRRDLWDAIEAGQYPALKALAVADRVCVLQAACWPPTRKTTRTSCGQ